MNEGPWACPYCGSLFSSSTAICPCPKPPKKTKIDWQARAEKALADLAASEQKCAELAASQIIFRNCTFTGVNPLVDPNIEHCVIRTMEADAAYRAQVERETLERVKGALGREGWTEDAWKYIEREFAPKGETDAER